MSTKVMETLQTTMPLSARKICRICSSQGDYDIFAVIPAYLHASPNDYLYWKKDISQLLEETTGLTISPDDGLPRKMCALCISYLKHAATFRQQAIDNTLSLKASQAVLEGHDKGHGLIETVGLEFEPDNKGDKIRMIESDLKFNENRKTETNNLVNNVFNNSTPRNNFYSNKLALLNKKSTFKNASSKLEESGGSSSANAMAYLNLLFDRKPDRAGTGSMSKRRQFMEADGICDPADSLGEELQTASSDDTDGLEAKDYFSYKEKSFIEDDIMSLDCIKDANIIINIPEHVKERKCPACFRRFMFENSYKEHMESCLEFKFSNLIENLTRLATFRRNKTISPHEFIRRMIFCLRATCQFLSTSCGEEISMPDLLAGNGDATKAKNVQSDRAAKDLTTSSETDDKVNEHNRDGAGGGKSSRLSEPDPLLEILRERADPSFIRYMSDSPGRLSRTTGSTSLCHSPQIDVAEKNNSVASDSDNSPSTDQNITIRSNPIGGGRKSLLESFNQVADDCTSTPKILSPATPMTINKPFESIKMNFTARCSTCDTIFESIASLEEHNLKYHNSFKKLDDHKRIIAMFESDEDVIGGGTVDILSGSNLNFCSMGKTESMENAGAKKAVKCQKCGKSFLTITHLDQHKMKCTSKKFKSQKRT